MCPLLEFVLTYCTLGKGIKGAGDPIRAHRFYLQHQHFIYVLLQVTIVFWETIQPNELIQVGLFRL